MTDKVATYYYVRFADKGASADAKRVYGNLIGRKFIFRCHKKFGLDKITMNLKLCFGADCVTQAEVEVAGKKGLQVCI